MTSTIASIRSDHTVTHEADESLVTLIRDALAPTGDEGLPLNEVLGLVAANGFSIPKVSEVMTGLIRGRLLDLSLDRRLRWIGPSQ
jgi:hypothetical protein